MAGLLLRGIALILALTTASVFAQDTRRDEVRVLIDVSGSMKRSDPKNLRVPALKLLVNLLPSDALAGAWIFAEAVTPLVPLGATTSQWRERAQPAAEKIHSRGLLTDIGAGLERASQGWQAPDPDSRRSLILLTDGLVDLGNDATVNAAARADILERAVPGLAAAGVTVHTIALSTDTDVALLQEMAERTGGSFEQVDSAEALQRVFLRMFERSVARAGLPLIGNRFRIDEAVRELTVLAFRRDGAAPTRLVPPAGEPFGAGEAPDAVRWYGESGYDLITIDAPATGEWQLLAPADPDNRALIVTDLALRIAELPDSLPHGQRLTVKMSLESGGDAIRREELLSLVDVRLRQHSDGEAPREWLLARSESDGSYAITLERTLSPGEHELIARASAKTFERERRHRLRIGPAGIEPEPPPNPEIGGALDDAASPAPQRPEAANWWLIGGVLLAVNGILLGLLAVTVYLLRRRRTTAAPSTGQTP